MATLNDVDMVDIKEGVVALWEIVSLETSLPCN